MNELKVNLSGLRIGNCAETEHFPEKNTKGPDVTFVVHLQDEKGKKECKYDAKCICINEDVM